MGETQQPIVHTPGPWEAILHDGGAFDVVNHDSPNHSCILAARNSYEARAGEMHANARLIAAAPELLEALQVLWKEVAESGNGWANDFGWRIAREKTLDALDKALQVV